MGKNIQFFSLLSLIFFLLFLKNSALAEPGVPFLPEAWDRGVHLIAGGGVNSTIYTSNSDRVDFGLGLNLKTDLGYYFNDNIAAEWSAAVKFNRSRKILVWDTLFTVGVRYRLDRLPIFNIRTAFVRVFVGRAPTVVFYNGDVPAEYQNKGVSKVQFDGPVAGFGVGRTRMTKSGAVWMTEFTATAQKLDRRDGVKLDGEVPIILFSERVNDKSSIFSVSFSLAMLVF